MIGSQLKEDIHRYLDMEERRLDMLLASLYKFRSADADMVDILCHHISLIEEQDLEAVEMYEQVSGRCYFLQQYPHHVKAISVASIVHNQVNHPDLVETVLRMNNHITLPVLLDVLDHPTNTQNLINAPQSQPA